MTLDAVISTLFAQANLDGRGSEILAAAITLRDSTGRDRKRALRAMCAAWGVQRQESVSGKWKDRSVATLHKLLTNAVCSAAIHCLPNLRKTQVRNSAALQNMSILFPAALVLRSTWLQTCFRFHG